MCTVQTSTDTCLNLKSASRTRTHIFLFAFLSNSLVLLFWRRKSQFVSDCLFIVIHHWRPFHIPFVSTLFSPVAVFNFNFYAFRIFVVVSKSQLLTVFVSTSISVRKINLFGLKKLNEKRKYKSPSKVEKSHDKSRMHGKEINSQLKNKKKETNEWNILAMNWRLFSDIQFVFNFFFARRWCEWLYNSICAKQTKIIINFFYSK